MKYRGKNKGVTLIALVVTIVVLLILAGVTLRYTVGKNGLVSTSQQIEKNVTSSTRRI